jgi:DNA polymerase elongation subunit (family B)
MFILEKFETVIFENNVDFASRFRIDCNITDISWITILKDKVTLRPSNEKMDAIQYEFDAHYSSL